MKKMQLGVILIVIMALLTISLPTSAAPIQQNTFESTGKLNGGSPLVLTGTLSGARYEIIVPSNWNGTLLVYAHGYMDQLPPNDDTDLLTSLLTGIGSEDEISTLIWYLLYDEGYALAATANKAAGWAVKEGIQNNLSLVSYFKDTIGKPDNVILLGFSMGSVIALESIEKYPGIYDAVISGGSLGAGTPRNFDLSLGFSLAFDVAFGGWPESWGSVGDLQDDLNFEQDVIPVLNGMYNYDPLLFAAKVEFIRLVCDFPGTINTEIPDWFLTDMYYATQVRAELEKRAGGPIAQNLDQVYTLDPSEILYLNSIGLVNAASLLEEMNETKITASKPARNYVEHYATFTGNLKHPVITIQTQLDEVVRVANEGVYRDTVDAAGKNDYLVQVFTDSYGHCNFTGDQIIQLISAMEYWLQTGDKPNITGDGFIDDFTIPPWPFSQP